MASINGIAIKNYKILAGHDGESVAQGSIYLNGKRLGTWSQDSWGGPDNFDFDTSVLKAACAEYKKGFPADYKYISICDDVEVFIGELAKLTDLEKSLKKYFNKGYASAVLVSDGGQMSYMVTTFDHDDPVVIGKYKKQIDQMRSKMSENANVDVIRPNSFDIKVDATHQVPAFLMSK